MLAALGCFFAQLSNSLRTASLACSFDIRPSTRFARIRAGKYGNCSLFNRDMQKRVLGAVATSLSATGGTTTHIEFTDNIVRVGLNYQFH